MKIMYLRSGPYEPSEKSYNLQEVGMLSELCKNGHDCDLFYYGKHKKSQIRTFSNGKSLKINWIKGIRLMRSGVYPSLLNKKRLLNYDCIICSEYSQIMTVLLSLLHPNVFCYNGPYYNLFKIKSVEKLYDKLFTNLLNHNINCFFCKSPLAEKYLHSKGIKKTKVIGVGQNMQKFLVEDKEVPSQNVKQIISEMDEYTFLFVGTIDNRKNFPFLLRSFALAFDRDSRINLLVIGHGNENYISKYMSMLTKKQASNIRIINFVPNDQLKFIYPEARALLLPSKLEIFGMVMIEAMSCGLPVISSFNGGSECLIKSHQNGVVADISNEYSWSDAIILLLDNSIRKSYSENCVITINNNFTWSKIVKSMEKEILKGGNSDF